MTAKSETAKHTLLMITYLQVNYFAQL